MAEFACFHEDDPNTTYLLPAGAGYYYVPAENVMVNPIRTNRLTSAEIDAVVRSNSPEAWKRCLTFGRVMRIRGVEGNALYTTFVPTDGTYEERRVLRLVPWRVAHACFPEVKEWAMCNPNNRERVWAEVMAIYDWKKEVDLPDAPHINPARNDWPAATLEHPVVVRTPAQIPPPPSDPMEDFALADPMEDWDAHLQNNAERRVPPPLPPRQNATPNAAVDVVNERANAFIEDHIRQMQAAGLLGGLPYLPPVAPAPVQPSAPMAEDLRALSDFLFECKDVVEEGAYLAASNALKRVWDRAI